MKLNPLGGVSSITGSSDCRLPEYCLILTKSWPFMESIFWQITSLNFDTFLSVILPVPEHSISGKISTYSSQSAPLNFMGSNNREQMDDIRNFMILLMRVKNDLELSWLKSKQLLTSHAFVILNVTMRKIYIIRGHIHSKRRVLASTIRYIRSIC